ncbi:MAG: LytTR family transcriptional regulator DNA-binding domain-containing protein [Thomasclavelia sp.]
MIKITIIDDKEEFCNKIKNILLQKFIDIKVFTCSSINQIDNNCDFMILSIDLSDYDAIEYAKANEDKKIIFMANHNQRFKEAFGPNIYGYINKNNLEDELVENISKMINRIKNQYMVYFKIAGEIIEIKKSNIIYCMYLGNRNIAVIYDNKQIIIKNKTLKRLLMILGSDFILINRSVVINKKKISKILNNKICLVGINCIFDISRRQKSLVLKAFYEDNKNY